MNLKRTFKFILLCSIIIANNATSLTFKSFKNFFTSPFFKKMEQRVIQKEFPLENCSAITLKNINGNIHIKTEWNRKTVYVQAVKYAPKKEMLKDITFNEQNGPHALTIKSVSVQNKTKTSIDYTLIVPSNATLHLATQNGNIKVGKTNGRVTATTQNGDIQLYHVADTIVATATQTGSIIIEQAQAQVKASTGKGNISIIEAKNSVIATTDKGKIALTSSFVPATSTIKLATKNGIIQLHLPDEVNADLQASTKRGAISCDHYVTLKPRTTKLDSKTWKQLQKSIDGTLGSGEAQVILSAGKGNIKIMQIKKA